MNQPQTASFPGGNPTSPAPAIDYAAIKSRQQGVWATGDYAAVGTTLQLVGEQLCEAIGLQAGERVLDVAAGNGNAALAAARRHADVIATDFVPELLERAAARAQADGLALQCQVADAEALPFADGAFDVVVSTFGVMFTPEQPRAAGELLRVCRRGGRVGLCNWTPDGFIGRMFGLVARFLPPPAGLRSPLAWGDRTHLAGLFAGAATSIATTTRQFVFRYRSPAHWLQVFTERYGPLVKARAALAPERRPEFDAALLELACAGNRAADGSLAVPSDYLEVVIQR